ncbi:MAG: hypothetical protein HQM09_17425 [Candidatus Riflebacteria bacterium]|nr:hypothetical protein [Candidatus Riflebacteria bacterium]
MSENKFVHPFNPCILVVAFLLLVIPSGFASTPDMDAWRFYRKIMDQLTVKYQLKGDVNKAIAIQKEAKTPIPAGELPERIAAAGKELIAFLEAEGNTYAVSRLLAQINQYLQPSKQVEAAVVKPSVLQRAEIQQVETSKLVYQQTPTQAAKKPTFTPPSVTPSPYISSKALIPAISTVPDPTNDKPAKTINLTPFEPNPLKNISQEKVTLNFQDVEISDIVRLLANKAGLNMVSRNQIRGQTTVNFENIPVGIALDSILRTNSYSYDVVDGVLWIFRRGEEPIEARAFFLKNALAADILPIVENCLRQGATNQMGAASTPSPALQAPAVSRSATSELNSSTNSPLSAESSASPAAPVFAPTPSPVSYAPVESGVSPTMPSSLWNVQVDDRSNSLIVTASRIKLNEVARLIEVLDISGVNKRQEERIFVLKYVDRATLESAIKMVIPRFDPARQIIGVKRSD